MDHTSHPGPVSRAIEVWQTRGAKELARGVAVRLGSLVFKTNSAIWYCKVLSPSRAMSAPGLSGAAPLGPMSSGGEMRPSGRAVPGSFAPVDPQELSRWLWKTGQLAWAADARELEVAAACGHRWTSWVVGADTVAFCKVGGRRVFIVDFDRTLCLPDGLAYLSDIYVMPRMRRAGIGRGLLARTLEFLTEDSFWGMVCHIPERNEPSIALFRSLGFEPLGKVRFTRVLGISAFSTTPEELLQKASLKRGSSNSAGSSEVR